MCSGWWHKVVVQSLIGNPQVLKHRSEISMLVYVGSHCEFVLIFSELLDSSAVTGLTVWWEDCCNCFVVSSWMYSAC